MPRRDTNDLNSPSNGGRGPAPDTYTPSPTHTVYSAQREETRQTLAATQGHTDRYPETAGTTGPVGQGETGGQGDSDGWSLNRTKTRHDTPTTATEPGTEPQTPHRVGVPRATTAGSTAPKKQTTATHLNTRRNATATGTTPRCWNHKRCRWSRKRSSQARQSTTHTKHHYPCQVEHPTPR